METGNKFSKFRKRKTKYLLAYCKNLLAKETRSAFRSLIKTFLKLREFSVHQGRMLWAYCYLFNSNIPKKYFLEFLNSLQRFSF